MPVLDVVTIQHERSASSRQVRISRNVKTAIDAMVFTGLKREKAAEKAGIKDHALYCAMRLPHVLAYLSTQQQVLRTSAAARSIARVDNLADDSDSDHVKLEANKFLLGIEGVSPIAKSESVNVHKHLMPGLTIVYAPAMTPGDDAHVIDGLAHGSEDAKQISNLPQRVPHPSERNGQR